MCIKGYKSLILGLRVFIGSPICCNRLGAVGEEFEKGQIKDSHISIVQMANLIRYCLNKLFFMPVLAGAF